MEARFDVLVTAPRGDASVPVAFTPPVVPPSRRVRWWWVAGLVVVVGVALLLVRAGVHDTVVTARAYAVAQQDLEVQLEAVEIAEAAPGTRGVVALPAANGVSAGPVEAPPPVTPIARMHIPAVGLSDIVVAGTDDVALSQGLGHMSHTAPLGTAGNAVVSGHSSTYGGPFNRLPELVYGDQVVVQLPDGSHATYEVRDAWVVNPGDVYVADPSDGVRLTLTTCYPLGSDAQRYIVQAELVDGVSLPVAVPRDKWRSSRR